MKTPNDKKIPNPSTPSLGQTHRARGRMVHVSKRFFRNPLSVAAEQASQPFDGQEYLPMPGETYNVGKNQTKREKRARRIR